MAAIRDEVGVRSWIAKARPFPRERAAAEVVVAHIASVLAAILRPARSTSTRETRWRSTGRRRSRWRRTRRRSIGNPSAWSQRWPIAVLAGVATVISSYMGFFQWGLIDSVWDPVFGNGTETVLGSEESHRMWAALHVPDAVFGAWGYLSEAMLSLVGSTRRWQFRPWMVLLFGFDVIPLGIVSVILVIVQGVSIGSWCFLCLITAAISLALIFLAYDEVWASIQYLRRVWAATRDPKLLWNVFWGRASAEAHRVALERS